MKELVKLLLLSLGVILLSCENEPLGEMNLNRNTIDEELVDLIKGISQIEDGTGIDCIRFSYAFVVFTFDANMEFIEATAIRGDQEFSNFLGALEDDYSISINYPISGTLNNGDLVEINTNEELKQAIDACRAEELRRRCNGTLIDCVWKVTELEGYPNDYEEAYYKMRYDGTIQFHLMNEVYFGTWTTLSIGPDVFLNIDLNDNPDIEAFWNLNWKVELRSNAQIEIISDSTRVLMERDCTIPCRLEGYQVCEWEDDPGFANFILKNYTPCIPIPYEHDMVSAVLYSFYETEEDAATGINPISYLEYINSSNPQTVYVRLTYKESGELLDFTEIVIEAINCT
ncbi:MAG: hypothetical protein AAFP76_12165 [Bacteroidota bacterium]